MALSFKERMAQRAAQMASGEAPTTPLATEEVPTNGIKILIVGSMRELELRVLWHLLEASADSKLIQPGIHKLQVQKVEASSLDLEATWKPDVPDVPFIPEVPLEPLVPE